MYLGKYGHPRSLWQGRGTPTRQLTPAERRELDQRMERQQERARRAEQEERRKEALNMAKPVNMYQEKLAAREQARVDKENDERQAAEIRRKLYDDQYAKWKSSMRVEDASVQPKEGTLTTVHDFVQFTKSRKLVDLEALANEFHLHVPEVVQRLNDLETHGALYGIIDDRSKFYSLDIYDIGYIDSQLKSTKQRLSIEQVHELFNNGTIKRPSVA